MSYDIILVESLLISSSDMTDYSLTQFYSYGNTIVTAYVEVWL